MLVSKESLMIAQHLQHKLHVIAWVQWIDYKMSRPLASKISKDFSDEVLAKLLVFNLIVSVTKVLVSNL